MNTLFLLLSSVLFDTILGNQFENENQRVIAGSSVLITNISDNNNNEIIKLKNIEKIVYLGKTYFWGAFAYFLVESGLQIYDAYRFYQNKSTNFKLTNKAVSILKSISIFIITSVLLVEAIFIQFSSNAYYNFEQFILLLEQKLRLISLISIGMPLSILVKMIWQTG